MTQSPRSVRNQNSSVVLIWHKEARRRRAWKPLLSVLCTVRTQFHGVGPASSVLSRLGCVVVTADRLSPPQHGTTRALLVAHLLRTKACCPLL